MRTIKKLRIGLSIVIFSTVFSLFAQEVTGSWKGVLKVQTQEIPIVFHVSKVDGVYSTTMDSPAQGAMGLPTDKTIFEDNVLEIVMSSLGVVYKGDFDGTLIKGIFTQRGMAFSLDLEKGKHEQKMKPQEPKEPYPYVSEEVYFENSKAGNIKLAGTLTLPKGIMNPPVAILITGSGPQNRNEEILGHKPFLVLSDHLTINGIAVLRYDDRGVAKSEGNYKKATTYDFADDVEAAFNYLKTRKDVIDINKIGLTGHSEGGMIAPIVASRNKEIAFCVLMAGPGITGKEILLTQTRKASELAGTPDEAIAINEKYSNRIYDICMDYQGEDSKNEIMTVFEEMRNSSSEAVKAQLTDEAIQQQIKALTSPWMLSFIQ